MNGHLRNVEGRRRFLFRRQGVYLCRRLQTVRRRRSISGRGLQLKTIAQTEGLTTDDQQNGHHDQNQVASVTF
jgi:hypothetical protein